MTYLNTYVYEPITLAHFQEVGLIDKDEQILFPDISPDLVADTEDISQVLIDYYKNMPDISDETPGQNKALSIDKATEQVFTEDPEVYSPTASDLLDKFSQL